MKRLAHLALALAAGGAAACGHGAAGPVTPPAPPHPTITTGPDVTPGIAGRAWLVGDWTGDGGATEHWIAAAGALFGVRFAAGGGYEVTFVDDTGEGGALQRWHFDGKDATGPTPLGDDLAQAGADAMTEGGATWHRAAAAAPTAPALEAADRAFEVATHARGADGWADAFAPDGAAWGATVIRGHNAIRADIAETLAAVDLIWDPVASRLAPSGALGFTVGKYELHKAGKVAGRGAYCTVWAQQPDGGWKIVADAGRPEN